MKGHMDADDNKKKRTQTLVGVWDFIVSNEMINGKRFVLSVPLVNEVIQHYLIDLDILKKRYNIEGKAQLHKISGLMASSILRFRPVVPVKSVKDYDIDAEMYANELLAILHGMSVCSEFSSAEDNGALSQEPWFTPWLNNFIYLLHHRHYTPESLCFIFATLSYFKFPENILNENNLE